MSFNVIYLIPQNSSGTSAEYGRRAKEWLLHTNIIDEPAADDDVYEGMFVNGSESAKAFEGDPDDDDEFPYDTGEIFAGPHFTLTPVPYVDVTSCPACDADLSGLWSNAVAPNEEEYRGRDDLSGVRLTCPACGRTFPLDQIKGLPELKFYLTDRFICFYDAHPVKAEWLSQFNEAMGCAHEVSRYWWT
jgi:uncharacterized protein YbaR (Trm112 family)